MDMRKYMESARVSMHRMLSAVEGEKQSGGPNAMFANRNVGPEYNAALCCAGSVHAGSELSLIRECCRPQGSRREDNAVVCCAASGDGGSGYWFGVDAMLEDGFVVCGRMRVLWVSLVSRKRGIEIRIRICEWLEG